MDHSLRRDEPWCEGIREAGRPRNLNAVSLSLPMTIRPFFLFRGFLPLLLTLAAISAAGAAPLPPIAEPATNQRLSGKLVWFDLVTDDAGAAQKFYGAVFGWSFAKNSADYTLISAGSDRIGGIFRRPSPRGGAPLTHWLTFVSVPDVAGARRKDGDRAEGNTRKGHAGHPPR